MAKKQFKSESKRLLDLMINSIYTHKEFFFVRLFQMQATLSTSFASFLLPMTRSVLTEAISKSF